MLIKPLDKKSKILYCCDVNNKGVVDTFVRSALFFYPFL